MPTRMKTESKSKSSAQWMLPRSPRHGARFGPSHAIRPASTSDDTNISRLESLSASAPISVPQLTARPITPDLRDRSRSTIDFPERTDRRQCALRSGREPITDREVIRPHQGARAESGCLISCGIRAGHRVHNRQITDRIIASAGVQLGGGHLGVHAGAGSTYRGGGCLAPTMGCHAGEPDEP